MTSELLLNDFNIGVVSESGKEGRGKCSFCFTMARHFSSWESRSL